jgi:flagellar motor switch protein FliN/FliY
MDKNELVSGILGAFSRTLTAGLTDTGRKDIRFDWRLTPSPQEHPESWTWWSGGLSTHPGAKFFLGAPQETWEKLGQGGAPQASGDNAQENASALISRCFASTVSEHFGHRADAQESGMSDGPSAEWTRVYLEIQDSAGQWPPAACVLSPEFEEALQRTGSAPAAPIRSPASAARTNPGDMLMLVQVPVSVSFGATQIRMQDLLNLTAGSVVELDQALHDNVEVRVNDRVIARGEVVAVDGHYGVRVLELVSGEAGKEMRP